MPCPPIDPIPSGKVIARCIWSNFATHTSRLRSRRSRPTGSHALASIVRDGIASLEITFPSSPRVPKRAPRRSQSHKPAPARGGADDAATSLRRMSRPIPARARYASIEMSRIAPSSRARGIFKSLRDRFRVVASKIGARSSRRVRAPLPAARDPAHVRPRHVRVRFVLQGASRRRRTGLAIDRLVRQPR